MEKPKILIIDDEEAICASLTLALKGSYDVSAVTNANKGLKLIKEKSFKLVLLDLIIGEDEGLEVLSKIKSIDSSTSVIMMTAYGSIRSSVEAIKKGAFTYLSKPLDIEELCIYIEQALKFRDLSEKVNYLSHELKSRYSYGEMIGKSPSMENVYKIIDKVKDVDVNVLISGESGTGKELVARAIHFSGNRRDEKFVEVNCAAIPEGLLEDEFFGHRKGSFTGAVGHRKGKFEDADKGTLFLDEIGDMPLSLQSKLLRVLQNKSISPIGSNETTKIDIRVIAATNRNLLDMVEKGTFRQDLYYRLNVIDIKLPPLKERREDILLLCNHLISRHNKEHGRNIKGFTKDAEKLLLSYDYPGNVRELENALEYAAVLSNGSIIDHCDLPASMRLKQKKSSSSPSSSLDDCLSGLTLKEIEKLAIQAALNQNSGKQRITAQQLGISERGLRNKIQEYGLLTKNNR